MTSLLDHFLAVGGVLHVAADGQMSSPTSRPVAPLLLPGSFSPVHRGHWELARVAEEVAGQPAAFELSVVNVDKPSLTTEEIRRRTAPFHGMASVWLTHAPRFLDKASLFPGATFVVGADTALRIVLPRYYDNDGSRLVAALARLRDLSCRFLVACRIDEQGQCVQLNHLPIPREFTSLFQAIPPERFRMDISSSALRGS